MFRLGILILIVWLGAAPHATAAGEPTGPDAFAAAWLAPRDIKVFATVENAAELRREIADRPIARWLNAIVGTGEIHKAWSRLAGAAKMNEGHLFDLCAGRRSWFMLREPGEWAVVSEVDAKAMNRLVQRLNVRIREPRHGMALSELPEQEMLLARNANMMVVGSATHSALFYELLPRIQNGAQPNGGPNRDADGNAKSPLDFFMSSSGFRTLGAGRIGVLVRHDAPLGGFSAAVADLHGDQLTIRHIADFESSPFAHDVTELTCDFSPVLAFEDRSLIAIVQPTDAADGPVEAFMSANLGTGLLSPRMRQNLGERRLIVVSEVEGRRQEEPVDLLSTTVVACVQLRDQDGAIHELDEQMKTVIGRLNRLSKNCLVTMPRLNSMGPSVPREVDLDAAADAAGWRTGGLPIMKNLSLNWTVADGPHGSWFVVASHRQSLDEVVEVLHRDLPRNPKLHGRFDSCGVANGVRLGRHLRSWMEQAEQFADPDDVEEFRSGMRLMSELAGGMQTCRWQLSRPSATQMRLDVQITLAPPDSARGD